MGNPDIKTTDQELPQKTHSVSRRLSYAFIGVVTLILFLFAVVGAVINFARIDRELQNRLEHAIKLAQISLPTPLWNLDNDVVDDFVDALFLEKTIVYVQIHWGGQKISDKKNPKYGQTDFSTIADSSDFVSKTAGILFEGSKVGIIQIVMSRESLRNEIIFQIMGMITLIFFLIVAISVTSIVITKRYISRPLSKLQTSAALIASGELDAEIDTDSRDEIGHLANDFNNMRGSIQQLFSELSESKGQLEEYSRTLEQQVENRTQQLKEINEGLIEALEQQTATNEILGVISSSPTDAQPIFDRIVKSALRLCDAQFSGVFQFDGELIHLVSSHGLTPEGTAAYNKFFPRPPGNEMAIERTVKNCTVTQITDIHKDPDYFGSEEFKDATHIRSVIAVPMLREGKPLGGIVIWRSKPEPFSDKQTGLLHTFADQAAITIENVHLFQELQERTHQLTRSVDELQALGEVIQAVSSTLDLEKVLARIVDHAVQLSKADAGTIYEFDETQQVFVPRANFGMSAELIEILRKSRLRVGNETVVGQAALKRRPQQCHDLSKMPEYLLPELQHAGYRSLLVLPLLREDQIIGALVVRRKIAGEFESEVLELLQTFANQSVLAIHNARLFKEIQVKGQELEIASQHKSQFLANMSHELRTPMNAIIGFSEVLLEEMFGDLNAKQEEYLQDIYTSGKHLLNLINDILDLSKIEAGKMELEPSRFSLRKLLDSSLIVIKERALTHGIKLSLDMSDDFDRLVADERKVKQIVFNLLSNAVKFTPDNGKVGIKAGRNNNVIEIAVWDTGVGIAPGDQKYIFEEFQQVGRTLEGKPEGTGLGLALTRKLVEVHGGRIWVESDPSHGSTFTFTLPAETELEVEIRA